MTEHSDDFDIGINFNESYKPFKIYHIYNKTDIYHLTKQTLIETGVIYGDYNFFFHIVHMDTEEFNDKYGSFACMLQKNMDESNIFMNIHAKAFSYIVNYIQTNKIDDDEIRQKNKKVVDEIIDLATMLGLPVLVTKLRDLSQNKN